MSSIGSTQAAYRGHRSRLEDAVKEKLIEKVTQEHGDETSRKTNLDTYLEDATRLLDGLMNTLHQHTSALIDEAAVNDALSRKHQDFIIQNIANMVKDTVDGRDAEMFFIGICNMVVCQWKIQREALMSLSPQRGSSSMYYNNSGDDLPHQGQSSTPNQGYMSTADVMRLMAEQQAKSSELIADQQTRSTEMMMTMLNQMTVNNSQQLAIQQSNEDRKKEVHDQKSVIANRISSMAKYLQPPSFKTFTDVNLSDVSISKLSEYFDQVFVFIETVEPQSAYINEYIRKLHMVTFTRGLAMDEQSVALTAQENYRNIRACHTRTEDENPPELSRFNERQRTIEMQSKDPI